MNNDLMTESVLAVAEKLFGRYGIDKTTMDDIAKAAHKSKRSLYNYFTGKEDIFRKVLIREINDIRSKANQILEANVRKRPCSLLKAYLLHRPELINDASAFREVLKTKFHDEISYKLLDVNEIVQDFNQWEHTMFRHVFEFHNRGKLAEKESSILAASFADMTQMALQGMNFAFFVEENYEQYRNSYTNLINLIIDGLDKKISNKKRNRRNLIVKINKKSK